MTEGAEYLDVTLRSQWLLHPFLFPPTALFAWLFRSLPGAPIIMGRNVLFILNSFFYFSGQVQIYFSAFHFLSILFFPLLEQQHSFFDNIYLIWLQHVFLTSLPTACIVPIGSSSYPLMPIFVLMGQIVAFACLISGLSPYLCIAYIYVVPVHLGLIILVLI